MFFIKSFRVNKGCQAAIIGLSIYGLRVIVKLVWLFISPRVYFCRRHQRRNCRKSTMVLSRTGFKSTLVYFPIHTQVSRMHVCILH